MAISMPIILELLYDAAIYRKLQLLMFWQIARKISILRALWGFIFLLPSKFQTFPARLVRTLGMQFGLIVKKAIQTLTALRAPDCFWCSQFKAVLMGIQNRVLSLRKLSDNRLVLPNDHKSFALWRVLSRSSLTGVSILSYLKEFWNV